MFELTKLIDHAYYHDEFELIIVYAPLGYGKTTYAVKTLAQLYKDNWEEVKRKLVFHPKDFVQLCFKMSETGKREKAAIWDDAGLWLFALDQFDPFVKAVIKYLNVARSNWGALIFTTPTPAWIINKIRRFPQNYTIKIIKATSDLHRIQRPRVATAYRSWVAPDFKHTGVRTQFKDSFDATMPKDFYNWYKPLRESYAKMAVNLMQKNLESVLKNIGDQTARDVITNEYTT